MPSTRYSLLATRYSLLTMRFISTRGQTPALGFSDAVATGLAPDGGLFLPETLPDLSGELARFEQAGSYPELCYEFLRHFATDIPADTLRGLVHASYTRFDHPEIAPLNIMHLASPRSAILSAVIFNALIIVLLIPLALRGVRYRPIGAGPLLARSLLVYGAGGVLAPFIGIKAIDLALQAVGLV